MGFWEELTDAVDPTSGWANPMSYGFKAVDALSGDINSGKAANDYLSIVPGIGDAMAQDKANKQNLKLDQMNRDWMERMSNTAYQRGMLDMKKAGLNPMLAYQQGGASVPNSTAPVVAPSSKTGLSSAALGAFTGITSAQSQYMNAQTAQAQAQSSIALQATQAAKTQAETEKTIDSIKNQEQQRKLLKQQETLKKVQQSAAEKAHKGLSMLEKVGDNVLKNTAKPSVDKKTLQYKKKWYDLF